MSNICLLLLASLRYSPLTLLACISIPAALAFAVLSYAFKRGTDEDQHANDEEDSPYSTRMSTRQWLAERYVPCALDAATVESIPLVKFHAHGWHMMSMSTCVVCLAPFQEDQVLKVLPPCQHVFHPLCIGPWFETNSTCPICRSEVALLSATEREHVEALATCKSAVPSDPDEPSFDGIVVE